MEDGGRCGRCLREGGCKVKKFAEGTLPFVRATLAENGLSEWDRRHALGRVLRGNGGSGSPGFIEDAILDGAMSRPDADQLVTTLVSMAPEGVTLCTLCSPCRHYQGPAESR